jgi:hypothetical protein
MTAVAESPRRSRGRHHSFTLRIVIFLLIVIVIFPASSLRCRNGTYGKG